MDSVADLIKQALELKEEGNKLFKEKQWRPALAKYGKIPLYVAHFEVAIPPPGMNQNHSLLGLRRSICPVLF